MSFYLVFSTFLMIVGGFLWQRSDIFDATMKLILLTMGFWGIFLELQSLGYILHK